MKFAIALFLISLLARIVMARVTGFDGLYGQDPFAYFNYSEELRQAIAAIQPPPPFFWPVGYPLLVVLASLLAGSEPEAAQIVSMLAGAMLSPLVYLLVLEIRPAARVGAFIVALLAAFSAQMMLSSLSVMSDATALFWITLSAWAMLRHFNTLGLRWLALAAFALGWAVLTRWAYGLAALPWAISALLAWHAARLPWRRAARAAGVSVLITGLLVGWQFVPSIFWGEISHVGNLQVYGWNPANALRSTISNFDGLFQYEQPMAIFYALPAVHPAFIFPLFLPLLILGLWQAVHLNRPRAALIIGWPLTFYIFLAGIPIQNPRFSLAFYPPLLAITALGLDCAWSWATALRPFSAARRSLLSSRVLSALYSLLDARYLLLAGLALALASALVWSIRDVTAFASWNQSRIAAAEWTESKLPAGSTVVSFDLTATLNHYTKLHVEEIYSLDPIDLAALSDGTSPLFVLLDPQSVETQWVGKSPQMNYKWLQENGELTEIGRFPPYTLFSFGPR